MSNLATSFLIRTLIITEAELKPSTASQSYTQQKSKANQSSVFKPLSTNNWF